MPRNIAADRAARAAEEPVVRFLLRLPAALHRGLVKRARQRGTSLNEHVVQRLASPEVAGALSSLGPLLLARANAIIRGHVLGIVVHGSWTRHETRTASDIDVLVVVDDFTTLARTLYRAWDEKPLSWNGRVIDAHFIQVPRSLEAAGGIWCEAAVEGRLLYDKTGSVEETLITIRRAIAEGRLVRKRVHGQPYWTAGASRLLRE